jgi:RNA recognition motif-containing protein
VAAAAAAGMPLFPSLVSGPGAHLPSHGVNQIFVNKLPYATTSQDLIDLFRHVGPVVRSEILWYNGRPKGTGLVRFEDRITCERAIGKFNGYLYGGRKLDIRMDKYSTST